MWTYKHSGLLMKIFQKDSRYVLEISGIIFGSYSTPAKAADDVACFCTDCSEWDDLEGIITDYPSDLSEWNQIR